MISPKSVMPIIILLLVIMLQILFVGLAVFSKIIFRDEIYMLGIPIYLLLAIILDILSLFLLGNIYQRYMEQKVKLTESTHEEQNRTLIESVKADHHDLKNHLTVISGLLAIESYDIVTDYVNDLIGDAHVNSQILNIQNPVLASLFMAKMDDFKKNHVQLKLNIASEKIVERMSSTDLIRLVSNLLDNAYDATMEMPIDQRYIWIDFIEHDNQQTLIIKNSSVLTEFDHSFFEMGHSSKSRNGQSRGFGLSIIQNIVKKYHGELDVQSENHQVCFKVQL